MTDFEGERVSSDELSKIFCISFTAITDQFRRKLDLGEIQIYYELERKRIMFRNINADLIENITSSNDYFELKMNMIEMKNYNQINFPKRIHLPNDHMKSKK